MENSDGAWVSLFDEEVSVDVENYKATAENKNIDEDASTAPDIEETTEHENDGNAQQDNATAEEYDGSPQEKNGNTEENAEMTKKFTELSSDDVKGMEFISEEEGYEFYSRYGKVRGFAIRRDEVYKDVEGNIVSRQLVCNKSGWRHKKHKERIDRVKKPKPDTRVGCPARIRFRRDSKTNRWIVGHFEDCHNHELTPWKQVHLMAPLRGLTDEDKAQIDSLLLSGAGARSIFSIMVTQKGGHDSVGFTKKDLANYIDTQRRERVKDGDSVAAITYLQGKADNDPMFVYNYTKTVDGNLDNLFWCDGVSRLDYIVFGDVIAFDSTYSNNRYNKPLVIICGYNHHKETTIFGAALVSDELIKTYVWVLERFTEAMFNKHPKAVVTDGDGAMREAIKAVWPNTTHRLCSWHIQKNATDNIKNSRFLEEFNLLVYGNYTPSRFDEKWAATVEKYGLQENPWMKKMYNSRTAWASTFMADKFFAGIRTTSLCEGINSFIKKYLQCKCSLHDFLHNFDAAMKQYRHNELTSDFNSTYTTPVTTTALDGIEEGAAKILTRKVFWEVKKEIELALGLNVLDRTEVADLIMLKVCRVTNRRKVYVVLYDKKQKKFVCDCGYFEFCGMPCCHIIAAMKTEYVTEFPDNLVSKRWLKTAKADHVYDIPETAPDANMLTMLRRGSMAAICAQLTKVSCDADDDYKMVMEDLHKSLRKVQERRNQGNNNKNSAFVIGDPLVVKTKGAPRKKKLGRGVRHCSHCLKPNHNINRCPLLAAVSDTEVGESSVEVNAQVSNRSVDASQLPPPQRKSQKRKCPPIPPSTQQSLNEAKESINAMKTEGPGESSNHSTPFPIQAEAPQFRMAAGPLVGTPYWPNPYPMHYSTGGMQMYPQLISPQAFHPAFPQYSLPTFAHDATSSQPKKFTGLLNEVERRSNTDTPSKP